MIHQPGCPENAGGDCDCFRFADVIHYRWYDGPFERSEPPAHSAAFVVGQSPRDVGMILLIALSDTSFHTSMRASIVAQDAASYRLCTATCPFNPGYAALKEHS